MYRLMRLVFELVSSSEWLCCPNVDYIFLNTHTISFPKRVIYHFVFIISLLTCSPVFGFSFFHNINKSDVCTRTHFDHRVNKKSVVIIDSDWMTEYMWRVYMFSSKYSALRYCKLRDFRLNIKSSVCVCWSKDSNWIEKPRAYCNVYMQRREPTDDINTALSVYFTLHASPSIINEKVFI